MDDTKSRLEIITQELELLKSESEIRRVVSRYMLLCDVPLPESEMTEEARADAVADLFAADGIWEGVGGTHQGEFGSKKGRDKIRAHFHSFYTSTDRKQVFNTHYLCSEHIMLQSNEKAEGRWVQFQPWIYSDGESLLRSSRLCISFRKSNEGWKIAHYRTENLFVAPLPSNWPSKLIETSVLLGGLN